MSRLDRIPDFLSQATQKESLSLAKKLNALVYFILKGPGFSCCHLLLQEIGKNMPETIAKTKEAGVCKQGLSGENRVLLFPSGLPEALVLPPWRTKELTSHGYRCLKKEKMLGRLARAPGAGKPASPRLNLAAGSNFGRTEVVHTIGKEGGNGKVVNTLPTRKEEL